MILVILLGILNLTSLTYFKNEELETQTVAKYVGKVSLVVGIVIALLIFSNADFNLLANYLSTPFWLIILVLAIGSMGFQSTSFGIVATREFGRRGQFFYFWSSSVRASLANLGLPFSGFASKLLHLKEQKSVPYRQGIKALATVSILRGFLSLWVMVFVAPLTLTLKSILLLSTLLGFALFLLSAPRLPDHGFFSWLKPLRVARNGKTLLAIFLAESVNLLLGALLIFLVILGLGVELDFHHTLLMKSAGTLVSLLPLTPLNLGSRDLVFYGILLGANMASSIAALIVLVERLVLLSALILLWLGLEALSYSRRLRNID